MSEKIIIASRAAGFAYAVLALVGGKSNRAKCEDRAVC